MASKFQTILDECKDELEATSFFDGIPIVTEFDEETIDSESKKVQALLQYHLATTGIVMLLAWESMGIPGQREGESGIVLHDSVLVVRSIENTEVNETGKNRLEVIERTKDTLHLFKPLTATAPLCVSAPGITRWSDDDMFLGNDISFVTTDGSGVVLTQAATPVIIFEDIGEPYTVQMSSDTVGAAIFYTTDGKKPNSQNGTLYTGQFILADPSTLKARAWLQGYRASNVATAAAGTVTPEDEVTLASIRAALIEGGGTFQLSTTGEPLIKSADDEYHVIAVTKPDDSVIADTGTVEQP